MNSANANLATIANPFVGRTLGGRYRIDRLVGRGGMGLVYLATNAAEGDEPDSNNRELVVKMLAPHWADDKNAIARFEREGRRLRQLDHPNIVALHDIGHEATQSYIVMEYIKGLPLRHFLKKKERLTLKEFIPIAQQILSAVGYAHNQKMMLRDIKPSNIMLCEHEGKTNFVKMLDFGLAKLVDGDDVEVTKANVIGTAGYLAPEQIRGEAVDVRVDVYALGILFFVMLTGQSPILGENDGALLYNHVHGTPRRLESLLEDGHNVPDRLIALVHQCMEKDPARRPSDANEAAELLFDCAPPEMFILPDATESTTKRISQYWESKFARADNDDDDDDASSSEWTRPHLRRLLEAGAEAASAEESSSPSEETSDEPADAGGGDDKQELSEEDAIPRPIGMGRIHESVEPNSAVELNSADVELELSEDDLELEEDEEDDDDDDDDVPIDLDEDDDEDDDEGTNTAAVREPTPQPEPVALAGVTPVEQQGVGDDELTSVSARIPLVAADGPPQPPARVRALSQRLRPVPGKPARSGTRVGLPNSTKAPTMPVPGRRPPPAKTAASGKMDRRSATQMMESSSRPVRPSLLKPLTPIASTGAATVSDGPRVPRPVPAMPMPRSMRAKAPQAESPAPPSPQVKPLIVPTGENQAIPARLPKPASRTVPAASPLELATGTVKTAVHDEPAAAPAPIAPPAAVTDPVTPQRAPFGASVAAERPAGGFPRAALIAVLVLLAVFGGGLLAYLAFSQRDKGQTQQVASAATAPDAVAKSGEPKEEKVPEPAAEPTPAAEEPAPSEANEEPAATLGRLAVETTEGATIFVDGDSKGALDGPLELEPGTYAIAVEADGFERWEGEVVIAAGDNDPLAAELTPVAAAASPRTPRRGAGRKPRTPRPSPSPIPRPSPKPTTPDPKPSSSGKPSAPPAPPDPKPAAEKPKPKNDDVFIKGGKKGNSGVFLPVGKGK